MGKRFISRESISSEKAILLYFILLKLALCLFPVEYGYFRDELYYIVLSDVLDFGYLAEPPLCPFLLAVVRFIFGTSPYSLHLLPAAVAVVVLVVTSRMIKELGGGRFAQVLGLTCVTVAPAYIVIESLYFYDNFDKLFWLLMLYMMVRLLKSENPKYWIYFGIFAGLGFLNKIAVLWLGFGIFSGLLMTKNRRYLLSRHFLAAVGLALLISSPYIIWQIIHGFPTAEYFRAYVSRRGLFASPLKFISYQILAMNFLAFPVWLSGLYFFLLNKKGGKFRPLGLAYFVILLLCIVQNTKFYMLIPYYTVLFAGGSVFIEGWVPAVRLRRLRTVYVASILALSLYLLPALRPLLPPDLLMGYMEKCGGRFVNYVRAEPYERKLLPHALADRFGWEEMTAKVAGAYGLLTEEEKAEACIIAGNYGEAAAIWVLGEKYNLPKPISGNVQFYLWGTGGYSGQVAIIIGVPLENFQDLFDDVREVARTDCELAMPRENGLPIYLCRGIKRPLKEVWPRFKNLY